MSPYDHFKMVTGGGWFVNSSSIWGSGGGTANLDCSDDIGINSDHLRWYAQHLDRCTITEYQTMFVEAEEGPVAYNAGGPNGSTNQLDITIENTTGTCGCTDTPIYCTGVIPTGGTLVKECKQYPPQQ